ncbi:MAG: DedA family protein [Candidatus Marinimicrobia bacterium]|nr:DedA family protein [Candidatus Neomarinimicrobiota bacterium]
MDNLLLSLESLPIIIIYAILFILLFMEYVTPFVPGDTFLVISAYLAGVGTLNPILTLFLVIAANIFGFIMVYYFACKWGREYFERRNFRFFSHEKIIKTENHFKKYGYWLIFVNRFLPGTRFFITLTAGFLKIDFKKSLLLNTLSVILWSSFLMSLGIVIGKNIEEIKSILSRYNILITSIVFTIIAGYIIFWLIKNSKARAN